MEHVIQEGFPKDKGLEVYGGDIMGGYPLDHRVMSDGKVNVYY